MHKVEENKSNWWKSISCCKKNKSNNYNTENKSGPYDYIVEKLIVQRVHNENPNSFSEIPEEVLRNFPNLDISNTQKNHFPIDKGDNLHLLTINQSIHSIDRKWSLENISKTNDLEGNKKYVKHMSTSPEKNKFISNFKCVEAPVEIHYKAPNLQATKNKSQSQIFHSSELCENIFPVKETDNVKDDSTETTLRWKIIIKHNKTTDNKNFKSFSSKNVSKSF